MEFGLDIAQQRMPFDEVVDRARFAEDLGFTGVWGFDHFVPMYGEGPGECFDGMTTLAALATATTRVRLGLMVTGVTYRHPSVFANQCLTIDHASHGRLDIGLGNAWFEAEHTALGIDFPGTSERFDLLEDQLEILTRLMTGDEVSYAGKRVSLSAARMRPLPVQEPHPPIWIGGSGPKRTMPLVARFADYWHVFGGFSSEQLDRMAELCEAIGRDPGEITRVASLSLDGSPEEIRDEAGKLIESGIGYLYCGWPGSGRDQIEKFATEVLP
ncbi:MAG TPA: TIGR03560 family F420-dependent LLM class oxidoreductase, partial [Phycicoccus sp.]|nr:TIGR03560 family F420-dependent LLM class oxidoreductase [Phycicoccus sp.]HQY97335.1 TIGR03560 family F420-dependent LLM class oxidoreductase [Phycicoccus sp.]